MLKNSDSLTMFPGYMVFLAARKIIENKTILFYNEANNVEMHLAVVSLSAKSTLNGKWPLHT